MYLLIQNNNQSYDLAGEDTRFSPEMPGSSLGDLYEFKHNFRFPDIFSNSNTGPSKLGVKYVTGKYFVRIKKFQIHGEGSYLLDDAKSQNKTPKSP